MNTIIYLFSNTVPKLDLTSGSHPPKKIIFFNKSPLNTLKNAFYYILKALLCSALFHMKTRVCLKYFMNKMQGRGGEAGRGGWGSNSLKQVSKFFEDIFLKYRCGYWKAFRTQQCLLTML